MKRKRASAVIIKDESILLIRRENKKGLYYVFPGGGVKEGETNEQAIIREMLEEGGVYIATGEVLLHTVNDVDDNTLFVCALLGDLDPVWQEEYKQSKDNTYELVWVPLSQLADLELLPKEGRDAVVRGSFSQSISKT